MASLASVRAAAAEILEREPRIDVIVDNAGTMLPDARGHRRGLRAHLRDDGPGAVRRSSRGSCRASLESPDARLVAVTSGGMYTQALPLDDLAYERGDYSGARAYARAKRAQVALIREWARRLRGTRRRSPTRCTRAGPTRPASRRRCPGSPGSSAASCGAPPRAWTPMLWLAAAPEARASTGRLFLDRRERPFDRIPSTRLSAADRAPVGRGRGADRRAGPGAGGLRPAAQDTMR